MPAALRIQAPEQTGLPLAEFPSDILDLQHVAEGQKLPGAGQRHVLFPFADGLVADLAAQRREPFRQFRLVQPLLLAALGQNFTKSHREALLKISC